MHIKVQKMLTKRLEEPLLYEDDNRQEDTVQAVDRFAFPPTENNPLILDASTHRVFPRSKLEQVSKCPQVACPRKRHPIFSEALLYVYSREQIYSILLMIAIAMLTF